jgi:hypothetical protein
MDHRVKEPPEISDNASQRNQRSKTFPSEFGTPARVTRSGRCQASSNGAAPLRCSTSHEALTRNPPHKSVISLPDSDGSIADGFTIKPDVTPKVHESRKNVSGRDNHDMLSAMWNGNPAKRSRVVSEEGKVSATTCGIPDKFRVPHYSSQATVNGIIHCELRATEGASAGEFSLTTIPKDPNVS